MMGGVRNLFSIQTMNFRVARMRAVQFQQALVVMLIRDGGVFN